MTEEIYRQHESRAVLLSPHYGKHVSHMTTEDLYGKGEIAEELAARDMEIERLRAELERSEANAKCGWQTANINEKARQAEMAKRDKAEAELTAIKGQIADPSWVCLEGMSASELAAYDYGSKCCMDALRRILNGEDKGEGTCNEPWEPLRRRVLALAAIKGQEPIAWVSEDSCDRQFINGKPRRIWWECMDGVGTPLYALPVADKDAERKVVDCWCEACDVAVNRWRTRMSICPDCGDKRCPKAANHDNACAAMANGNGE